MNTGKIAVRYAKALYELASEQKKEDKVYEDVKLFFETCKVIDFQRVLENPTIVPSEKAKVFTAIFGNKVDKLSINFINLLARNKREIHLQSISRSFLTRYRKNKGVKSVTLTTAKDADAKVKKAVEETVSKNFNAQVELKTVTDESIIGGFVLTIEDRQYDAAVASKLQKIKSELLSSAL